MVRRSFLLVRLFRYSKGQKMPGKQILQRSICQILLSKFQTFVCNLVHCYQEIGVLINPSPVG